MAKKVEKDTKEKVKITKKENKDRKKQRKIKNKEVPKKRETVLFANSEEEAQELIKQISAEEPTIESKEEKKKSFWSEVKAFFGIILIIGLFIGLGILLFKFVDPIDSAIKDVEEENKIVETNGYKTVTYNAKKGRFLSVYNNIYLVEHDGTYVYKVLDMDTNVLFEGKEGFSELQVGTDDKLYLLFYEEEESHDDLTLYVFENNKIEEVNTFKEDGYFFTPLLYNSNSNSTLLGIVGERYSYDEEFNTQSKIFLLNGKEYETGEYRLVGDSVRLDITEPMVTYDEKYVIANSNDGHKVGVYDLSSGKMVINAKYDGMYSIGNDEYIAIKNQKAGIVNVKSKIIVDFKYDFIDHYNDFSVVSSNGKLGILDKNYKVVVEPKFTYQEDQNVGFSYNYCCGRENSIAAYRFNDKYVLTVNANELNFDLNYSVHETYVIDSSGEYMTIQENDFNIIENFIYSYDKEKKIYTIFDKNFAEKYTIDISGYDIENYPVLNYINEHTISIEMDTTLYFDALTGKEIEEPTDTIFVDDKIEFKLSETNKTLTVKVDGKVISTFKDYYNYFGDLYYKIDDNTYYSVSDNSFVLIRKSE